MADPHRRRDGAARPRRRGRARHAAMTPLAVLLLAAATFGALGPVSPARATTAALAPALERYIVREVPGRHDVARRTVERLGGSAGRRLALIDGFEARLAPGAATELAGSAGVVAVTPDATVRLAATAGGGGTAGASLAEIASLIGATELWRDGVTGAGVDVALIDSGVVPVDGLAARGSVVNGPDLSFDRQAGAPAYLDTFGHGTHLAGIIAGRDRALAGGETPAAGEFAGIAPGARIVSVKVASAGGETDVSQVIAAIDWVVQHRTSNGLNIRVLNLSFGTDATQPYGIDPLAYAVEVAWRRGIVVVVAAGNAGEQRGRLSSPAIDPFVLAVGASDPHAKSDVADDTVPAWSSPGDEARSPDLVAPGVQVPSLRSPGSILDLALPSASGSRFIRGSGTSQAAAVVSGAVALLLADRPQLTPDQVKALLTSTAASLPAADLGVQGAGMLDVGAASRAPVPSTTQRWARSTGTGSLDAARGSIRVTSGTSLLEGERDIFGTVWDGEEWTQESLDGKSWDGGKWNGAPWAGKCFCATAWSGPAWGTVAWSGLSWSGLSWSGLSWSGLSWSGLSWSGLSWSGLSWSGLSWSGLSWSGLSWSGLSWSGSAWSTAGWSSE
jgi:subtilisin family serine protease